MYRVSLARSGYYYVQEKRCVGWRMVGTAFFKFRSDAVAMKRYLERDDHCCCCC